MRRVLAIVVVLAGIGGFVLLAGGAREEESKTPSYWVELDNAFGLTPGSDFKVAGVRAGKITTLRVERRTKRALVGVQIDQAGFSLKTDVTCETRPQSLIGEYFIDCDPGRSPNALRSGSTIPVSQTFSTIPADLVNNVLRLPQRQRLRIILNELGVGLAARGEDLNAVVRRGVPALRETNRLLDLLADENRTLEQLTVNADHVVAEITANRKQLTRFIREARDTSAASADRQLAMRQTFRRLPAFLRQLRPTMADLGRVADEQVPTLQDLDAASTNLKAFLDELGPFSDASRPSLESLGDTSRVGRETVPPAMETVERLNAFSGKVPELAQNLRIVLDDLYDPQRAVEPDPRSPGGDGYNGFEALLRYVWSQSQAINIFDRNGYILKVAVYHHEPCTEYHDQSVKHEPEVIEKCASALGPTQPGINAKDPSVDVQHGLDGGSSLRVLHEQEVLTEAQRAAGPLPQSQEGQPAPRSAPGVSSGAPGSPTPGPAAPGAPAPGQPPIDLTNSLKGLLAGVGPGAQVSPANSPGVPAARPADLARRTREGSEADLLSYLLGR